MISLVIFLSVVIAGLGFFLRTLYIRFRVLRSGQPTDRFDHFGRRIKAVLVFAFGQKKFVIGEQPAGWMHFFIFWGFVILVLQITTMFGRAFSADFFIPGFGPGQFGGPFFFVRDVMEVIVIVVSLIGLYRWQVSHPARLYGFRPAEDRLAGKSHWEGPVILLFILTIMVSGLVYDGGRLVSRAGEPLIESERAWEPISGFVASILSHLGRGWAEGLSLAAWWVHNLIILTFLNLLPRSKHFHIVTAIPNVFFHKLEPMGALNRMDLENAQTYGTSRIDQFTWKQMLDMYSCTECGRCTSQCPATASGKVLAPRQLLINLRDYLYEYQSEMIEKNVEKSGKGVGEAIVGDRLIRDAELWACTTCRACEEACPVLIEYVDKIVDMRRHLVQDEARFPSELIRAFNGMESQSNPWGLGSHKRADWAQGLDVPLLSDHPESEYLYYVGCAGAFDDRNRKITIAFTKILKKAGVSFAILGKDEPCNGDSARRLGNEYLFQNMAQHLVDLLNSHGVKKIIVNCPHCYNTLKNEYPQFGGHYEVTHAADLILKLIQTGKLKMQTRLPLRITYHDSCYYGRHNGIYETPRRILSEISASEVREMPRSKSTAMCCGGGGGWMWMEEPQDHRVSHRRIDQALETSPEVIATSCPYCMIMLTDGLKAKDAEEKVRMMDVVELVEGSLAAEN